MRLKRLSQDRRPMKADTRSPHTPDVHCISPRANSFRIDAEIRLDPMVSLRFPRLTAMVTTRFMIYCILRAWCISLASALWSIQRVIIEWSSISLICHRPLRPLQLLFVHDSEERPESDILCPVGNRRCFFDKPISGGLETV